MLKVCISGGPCSGKSSCLSKLHNELSQKLNKKVFIVPETATELISNGIAPGKHISLEDFQEFVLDKQLAKEKLYDRLVNFYNTDDIVILYDRGLLDVMAYVSKDVFQRMLKDRGISFANINDRYDVVIHLTTAAKETNAYTRENNDARRETAEEAIRIDDETLKCNVLHPHMRVVPNKPNFDEKVNEVLSIVFDALGVPSPSEIERKFLIKKPDDKTLNEIKASISSISEITQTYLVSINGIERRVRKRGTEEDGYSLYYTEKIPVSDFERYEKEEKISMERYISLLDEADASCHQLKKTRYCFLYKNQYFEMDLYPFSDGYAILEIELLKANQEVLIPPFINVIKEVTDDANYKNHQLAKTQKL